MVEASTRTRRWTQNVAVASFVTGLFALVAAVAGSQGVGRILPRSWITGLAEVAPSPVGPRIADVASAPLLAWVEWYPLAFLAVSGIVAVPLAAYLLAFATPIDGEERPSLTEGGFDVPLPEGLGGGILDADDLAIVVFVLAAVVVVTVAIVVGYALVLVGATLLSRRWGLRGLGLAILVGDAVWGVTVVLEPDAVFLNRAVAIVAAVLSVLAFAVVVAVLRAAVGRVAGPG